MRTTLLPIAFLAAALYPSAAQSAPQPISLDEYMNATAITSARLAPDGASAVIATEAPDWKASVYRHDLWLWTAAGLRPLTHTGSEEDPQWSPDGKWIAFLSDRTAADPASNTPSDAPTTDSAHRLWVIPASGGEALPLFQEALDVHAFAWSPDSSALYYSTEQPLTQQQQDDQKDQWKDVIRWREHLRGDVLVRQDLAAALKLALAVPPPVSKSEKDKAAQLPADSVTLAHSALSITQLAVAPGGQSIAFVTGPSHLRIEDPADYELYLVPSSGGEPSQLTHNQAVESHLRWSPDGRWLYFSVDAAAGSLEGPYRDVQGRLYRLNPNADPAVGNTTPKIDRLGAEFPGSFASFTLLPDGRLLALGQTGIEQQLYLVDGPSARKLPGQPGFYSALDTARTGSTLLLNYSSITQPNQIYLAADPLQPAHLQQLTSFNPIFAQRAQPTWQPYSWKSDDGRTVQGVLIFPPGKQGQQHLRMITLIHGGPGDADGNRFGADWYDWATLAAANNWLVFRPNYRGSSSYGDDFMLAIQPHLVSAPGRDILTGVDALVRDGYADPDHLAIGGYSYGGYMTNWLLTQTTRFRSAVTGAGAVEHAANWGNDDETFDDAWYLGGPPWQNPALYQSEAALFQFDRVRTPTHLVQGNADVRVSYLEGVTMERALQHLGVPHTFLVFPGEGHSLAKNPWHGYIKVRDELQWLETWDHQQPAKPSAP